MSIDYETLVPRVSRPWMAVAVAAWTLAALLPGPRQPLDTEWIAATARVVTDSREGTFGSWALVEAGEKVLLMEHDTGIALTTGDLVDVDGVVAGEPGRAAGREYDARLRAVSVEVTGSSASPLVRAGNAMRKRVVSRLQPLRGGRALLAGFLIGDTGGLTEAEVADMRRTGLAHFVAVSGSNVALYLGLVAIVAGPLGIGARRRALLGLTALPIYAAATRFEPSVMRASVMAGLALGGRLAGVVFETWQLLSLAVVILVAAEPALTANLGFQLSVAATAGVIVGARWPLPDSRVARALAVTLGAQVAVAPLLLAWIGEVPLAAPLANLVAAPLVAISTVAGALGVIGPGFLVSVAAWLADFVLFLARGAAVWPQLGPMTAALLISAASVAVCFRPARPVLALLASGALTSGLLGLGAGLPDPGAVVLDVGQGDAILLHGGEGRFALVDGGPNELALADALRRYGVDGLQLMVLSHVHADHATGLTGVVSRIPVARVWASPEPHSTPASARLLDELQRYGLVAESPAVGEGFRLGELTITVEGPLRPYASPNDQSVVLMVRGPERTMLLPGDIETFAQAELGHLRAEVLKVPHQGAATSDPDWLRSVGAEVAVISVGPNSFGHPADWVVELLESTGATVLRTDQAGDVVIPLG